MRGTGNFAMSPLGGVGGDRFDGRVLSRDAGGRDIDGTLQTADKAFFEASPPQNVSALMGKTAFLTCVVRNLGKAKSVSFYVAIKSTLYELAGTFCHT